MTNTITRGIILGFITLFSSSAFNYSNAQIIKKRSKTDNQGQVFSPDIRNKRTGEYPKKQKSNNTHRKSVNNLPPGHAKKIYGEKSAKSFAPGQQKKTQRQYTRRRYKHVNNKANPKHDD